jgi:hypothetical protein
VVNDLMSLLGNYENGASAEVDYLQFALVMVMAIIFGMVLKLLYQLYFQDNEPQDGSLARGLVILTPALAAIFWMVQSSMVLSIGLLGALSLIRFRTPVKRVEDVAFISVMLAVAIAVATRAFLIPVIMIALLFLYALFKNRTILGIAADKFAVITFNTKKNLSSADIQLALQKLNVHSEFISSRAYDGITSYVFSSGKVNKAVHDKIHQCLVDFDQEAHINVFYPNERLGV